MKARSPRALTRMHRSPLNTNLVNMSVLRSITVRSWLPRWQNAQPSLQPAMPPPSTRLRYALLGGPLRRASRPQLTAGMVKDGTRALERSPDCPPSAKP